MSQQHELGKHATTVATGDDGMITITFHQTQIVRFDDEKIILKTNGWETPTTKTRMNQASNQFQLGFYVFQKDWAWYVGYNGETLDFNDGMEIARR